MWDREGHLRSEVIRVLYLHLVTYHEVEQGLAGLCYLREKAKRDDDEMGVN